jgi:antitoxin VapB
VSFYHIAGAFYREDAMGQLNIKDEALIADAKALAELLGTSTTGALRDAVSERLARLRAERRRADERFVEELLELGRQTAASLPPHLRTSDHSDLYDEHGLPK